MTSMVPSITSAGSSSSGFGTAASSSLTASSSSALPVGLSAGAEAGIALGVIIAVLLFLILLTLYFFPYRRKRHHSKQAAESLGIAGDERGHASIEAEKSTPTVTQNALTSERTTGKGYGGSRRHEQSEMLGVGIHVKQLTVAKDPIPKSEGLNDARSSRFEPPQIVHESSPVASLQPPNVSISAPPPQTEEQCLTYVEDFISNNIHQFFGTNEEVENRAKKAMVQAEMITEKYGLRPELTPEVMKLAFYDFVILCDDSSSMKCDAECIPTLYDTLRRVAEFATILEPGGISVRFLNHNEDFDGLTNANDIENKVAMVPFLGNTRLGTVLDCKIVQPMIIQKVRNQKLRKPVFVVIITDGQPDGEPSECLRNTILSCKESLALYKFRDPAAVFLISLVGESEEAKVFLESLGNDKEMGDMVFCSTENLVTRLAAFPQSGDVKYTAWLIELFVAALGKQTQRQRKGKQSVKATQRHY